MTSVLHLPGPVDMAGGIFDELVGDTVVVVGDIVGNIVWDTVDGTAEDTVANTVEDIVDDIAEYIVGTEKILQELVLAKVTVWSVKGDM